MEGLIKCVLKNVFGPSESKRVYCHEALALHAKLQNAGFRPEAEPWDEVSDSDSDQSDEADEADEVLRLMV